MSNVARKNLILGAADNYDWPQLRPWAESIRDCGFEGDVVLLAYRVTDEAISRMTDLGILVYQVTHDDEGQPIDHHKGGLPTQTHKLRNFHMWQFLQSCEGTFDTVVVTDTRDVYFQQNPDPFLNKFAEEHPNKIAMPSENVLFKNETWNAGMIQRFFGMYVSQMLEDKPTCNSGTFFGPADMMASTMLTMYFIQKNFNATGVDQPTLNFLGYINPHNFMVLDHNAGWACQCGTTLDPTKQYFRAVQVSFPPRIRDEQVITSDGTPYVICHQYDRVPALKHLIEKRYA